MDISKALGRGHSNLSIITSVTLAIISFFYLFTLGSFFKTEVFVLQNGTTYDTFFDVFLINKSADLILVAAGLIVWLALSLRQRFRMATFATLGGLAIIAAITGSLFTIFLDGIALSSLPIILALLICNKLLSKKILYESSDLCLNYLAILGISTGLITIIISLLRLSSPVISAGVLHDYAYDIFALSTSVSPILMILLVLGLPLKLVVTRIVSKFSIYQTITTGSKMSTSSFPRKTIGLKYNLICLSAFMLLSIAFAIIPHLPTVNPNHQQVTTDTSYWLTFQNDLAKSKNPQQLLYKAFVTTSDGDRPLALLLVFAMIDIVHADAFSVLDHLPIILAPPLVVAVFLFTRELTSNDVVSLLAAFVTTVSFQTLIGIYAGFYANWIALTVGYLAFVFLLRFLKIPTKVNLIIFIGLMVLLLLLHEYTWTILTITMGIFLTVMFKLRHYRRRSTILLLVVILSTVILDLSKTAIVGLSNGFGRDVAVAYKHEAGISQFANRWNNLKDTMQNYYAAQFSNFIILGLALYWLLRTRLNEESTILLIIFLSIGILPIFFGELVIQTRVFYDIPFQIPAAIGLGYIRRHDNGVMMMLPICIWLIALSVRAVSNFTLPS